MQAGLSLLADRSVERHWSPCVSRNLSNLVGTDTHLGTDLFVSRLTTQLLIQPARYACQPVDDPDHVHGETNGMCVVGERTPNRLTNAPGRVGRKPAAQAVVE